MRITSLLAGLFALLLVVTPVVAHHKDDHDGGRPKDQSASSQSDGSRDCDGPWRNHGHFVSCVAHEANGRGGDVELRGGELEAFDEDVECADNANAVSCAARSDVGKDNEDNEED